MQLHAGPPGDMTESSLAWSRDELLLHLFCPFHFYFLCTGGLLSSSASCHSEKKKKRRYDKDNVNDCTESRSRHIPFCLYSSAPHQDADCSAWDFVDDSKRAMDEFTPRIFVNGVNMSALTLASRDPTPLRDLPKKRP